MVSVSICFSALRELCVLEGNESMMQTEASRITAADRRELEKQIKFLEGKVEEFKFPEDIKELRRLRRLR